MERVIKLETHHEAQTIFGLYDENLKTIEKEFKVRLDLRGEHLKISGTAANIKKASRLIECILEGLRSGQKELGRKDLRYLISDFKDSRKKESQLPDLHVRQLTSSKLILPRTKGQREYVEAIKEHDIVFAIGPAGTGKTYLAMTCAV